MPDQNLHADDQPTPGLTVTAEVDAVTDVRVIELPDQQVEVALLGQGGSFTITGPELDVANTLNTAGREIDRIRRLR